MPSSPYDPTTNERAIVTTTLTGCSVQKNSFNSADVAHYHRYNSYNKDITNSVRMPVVLYHFCPKI